MAAYLSREAARWAGSSGQASVAVSDSVSATSFQSWRKWPCVAPESVGRNSTVERLEFKRRPEAVDLCFALSRRPLGERHGAATAERVDLPVAPGKPAGGRPGMGSLSAVPTNCRLAQGWSGLECTG